MSVQVPSPPVSQVWGASAPAGTGGVLHGGVDRLAAQLDREQGRWFLWLPVFFGLGIAAYFSLSFEPPGAIAFAAVLAALSLRVFGRFTLSGLLVSSMVLAASFGFAAAKLRTWMVAAPILERQGAYDVTGLVEVYERRSAKRGRVTLRVLSLSRDGKAMDAVPYRARVTVNGAAAIPPGSAIKLRAVLFPPPEPVQPGGYDFGRSYFFQGIGASGYSLSKAEPLTDIAVPWDAAMSAWLARLRLSIADRIRARLPGQTGAIAAALIVGERAELNEGTLDIMRASGLAHVLSISGLHMTLVAGSLYWLIRWGLALVPALALRFPIRGWAAGAALIFATVYLALSGAAVATQRSYLMIAVIFLAVMLNRPALSLRNVALAGLAILAVMPESLMDASFQMSFAATAALIAGYEAFGRYLRYEGQGVRDALLMQPVLFVAGTLATTLVASLATAPFSAFHFHNAAPFSALGNLLGMPAVSLVVMPMAILTLFVMPFGLEGPPLQLMGFGIEMMVSVATFVSSLDNSLMVVPAFPTLALALMTAGGLWLMIWRQRWRYAGLAVFALGLALTPLQSRPDILVDREGKLIAVRASSGELIAPKTRKAPYALEQWLKADGDGRKPKAAAAGHGFQCDLTACITSVRGHIVSYVMRPEAFAQDCKRAAILVTPLHVPDHCTAPEAVIDRSALRRHGAHGLTLARHGILVETVSDRRGNRPWSPPRHRREKIEPVEDAEQAAARR